MTTSGYSKRKREMVIDVLKSSAFKRLQSFLQLKIVLPRLTDEMKRRGESLGTGVTKGCFV